MEPQATGKWFHLKDKFSTSLREHPGFLAQVSSFFRWVKLETWAKKTRCSRRLVFNIFMPFLLSLRISREIAPLLQKLQWHHRGSYIVTKEHWHYHPFFFFLVPGTVMLISTDFLLGDCSLCDVDASFLSLPIPSLWSATFASDKKAKEDQEMITMNS